MSEFLNQEVHLLSGGNQRKSCEYDYSHQIA